MIFNMYLCLSKSTLALRICPNKIYPDKCFLRDHQDKLSSYVEIVEEGARESDRKTWDSDE